MGLVAPVQTGQNVAVAFPGEVSVVPGMAACSAAAVLAGAQSTKPNLPCCAAAASPAKASAAIIATCSERKATCNTVSASARPATGLRIVLRLHHCMERNLQCGPAAATILVRFSGFCRGSVLLYRGHRCRHATVRRPRTSRSASGRWRGGPAPKFPRDACGPASGGHRHGPTRMLIRSRPDRCSEGGGVHWRCSRS